MEPRYRLSICLLVSTVIVGGLLMLIRMPEAVRLVVAPELSVTLIEAEEDLVEPDAEVATPEVPLVQATIEVADETAVAVKVVPRVAIDWSAEISDVVSKMSLPSSEPAVFNVAQMEKRRRAAEKFAPIPSHDPVPIWENVARDMTGRSVLVHGDCEKVIDDPNVGSRDAFEVFGQYIVTCKHFDEKPKLLAWVEEINSRREGLSRYDRPVAE